MVCILCLTYKCNICQSVTTRRALHQEKLSQLKFNCLLIADIHALYMWCVGHYGNILKGYIPITYVPLDSKVIVFTQYCAIGYILQVDFCLDKTSSSYIAMVKIRYHWARSCLWAYITCL